MPNLNPRVIGDLPYPNRMAVSNAPLNVGGVTAIPITTPGTGYLVGDQFVIDPPPAGGIQATAEVSTIDGVGGVTGVKITNPGAGYAVAPGVTLPLSGTGVVIGTVTVSDIVPVTFGLIYSTDAFGRLIVPVVASNTADLTKGVLQVQANTFTGDGNTRVQVVTPPTRIILKADAGLKKNDKVDLKDASGTTTNQDKVKAGGDIFSKGYIGRVFEIETHNADGSVKELTADDDLVVIDMGVAQ